MTKSEISLRNSLSKLGEVLVFKNDYVFTLLMKLKSSKARNVFDIIEIVTNNSGGKETVEVIKNDDEYLLIVLK